MQKGTKRMPHGGQILVRELETQGVETVYCVPGESYLAALDGLHDSNRIRTIICRQEGGASMMAEAAGKLTGRPGVCFVTRGPGSTNGSIGVHIAQQDSTPLVMFVGLPGRDFEDREAFQEFDFKSFFRAIAKSAEIIPDAARIPEYVSRAFSRALSGRPGPVVLGLPEDMLASLADVEGAKPVHAAQAAPLPADMAALSDLLAKAKRPLAIVGGPGWSAEARSRMEAIAERWRLPVGCAFRCQDYFDGRHPCYAGHVGIGIDPKLAERIKTADLLIVIGERLGEMPTGGYTLLSVPDPAQKLVHVHPQGDEIGRVYRADLAIAASAMPFLEAFAALAPAKACTWGPWSEEIRAEATAFRKPIMTPGLLKMEQVALALEELLPEDAILTNGAGNYTTWFHKHFNYKAWRSQLAPACGAMGYGVPAAIAAKLMYPRRTVVALAGDGCFMMNGQELATAHQYGADIIVLVVNNGMYGTIRMHQEREYPGRVHGTALANPDFAALSRAYGGFGETVTETGQFRAALRRALEARAPALIELQIDPEAITPGRTMTQIRDASLKK